jgi:hypothetical protein
MPVLSFAAGTLTLIGLAAIGLLRTIDGAVMAAVASIQ